mgnify:CR=1 FL=1
MKIELLDRQVLPEGFSYPASLQKIIELNLVSFDIWYLFDKENGVKRLEGLRKRYPDRVLVPFARRSDNDDIACLSTNSKKVFIIHDFASAGYEQKEIFSDVWMWLKYAIDTMIDYERMELE